MDSEPILTEFIPHPYGAMENRGFEETSLSSVSSASLSDVNKPPCHVNNAPSTEHTAQIAPDTSQQSDPTKLIIFCTVVLLLVVWIIVYSCLDRFNVI